MPNSEDMVRCPYNGHHIILKSRFSAHLCKCRKQYVGNDFAICPFNATHNILKPEFQYHVDNCPDRGKLDSHLYVLAEPGAVASAAATAAASVEVPPSSENWDDEPGTTTSYLDVKDSVIEKLPVLRLPIGKSKSERKRFFESEIKRFESLSKAEMSEPSGSSSSMDKDAPKPQELGKRGRGRGMLGECTSSSEPSTTISPTDDSFSIVVKNRGRGRTSLNQP